MQLSMTVDEVLRLAASQQALPPMVRSVRAHGDAVTLEVDPRLLPDLTGTLRFAVSLAGVVPVVVRFAGFADGVATFALDVQARGLPVQSLIGFFAGTITTQLSRQGLPPGAVEIRRDPDGPVAVVRVQAFLEPHVSGLTVTGLDLRDETVHVTLGIGDVVVHRR